MINGISASGYNSGYGFSSLTPFSHSAGISPSEKGGNTGVIRNPNESTVQQAGRKSSPAECEACSTRKYKDGSDENVSFKSATHIPRHAAATAVRAHEQEHVSNAYTKAAKNDGKVLSASVAIHTAICPECGRTYVSGGTTTTKIKYNNEDNPYQQNRKQTDAIRLRGLFFDEYW
ncbi:MAG: hypothetical protein IJC59_01290 [Lachnospiraceae bacterium]|nr:hypothetical protein [Lachnospiraceae bacterium]